MKRLLLTLIALLVSTADSFAQKITYHTETAVAYRATDGNRMIDSMCRLDLSYPADKPGFTTVIWFHGGGLSGGHREIP